MTHTPKITRRLLLAGLSLFFAASQLTHAAEIRVITSGAFTEAYKKLVPVFEKQTGHHVISAFGASVGNAPDSIPTRFSRGEKFDLVILSDGGLEALVKTATSSQAAVWIWFAHRLVRQFAKAHPSQTSARLKL